MNQYNRNDKLRVYYDAEFTGLSKKTSLISIGLISDSETTFYAEFTDYNQKLVTDWLATNVIGNLVLTGRPDTYFDKSYTGVLVPPVDDIGRKMSQHNGSPIYSIEVKGSKRFIKHKLLEWLTNESDISGKQIQFMSDCYAYDWVLMNDVICEYGDALNIPSNINYIPIDLSTLLWSIGVDPDISREEFAGPVTPPDNIHKAKHNCLWDAYIAKVCFEKILAGTSVNYK